MVIGWHKMVGSPPFNNSPKSCISNGFLPYCPAQKILTPRFVGPRFESEDYTNLGVVTAQIFFCCCCCSRP